MRRDSAGMAPPHAFRQAGAVASVIAAQVAEAAIQHAEAEGDHAKAARLRRLYDEYLQARHREFA